MAPSENRTARRRDEELEEDDSKELLLFGMDC